MIDSSFKDPPLESTLTPSKDLEARHLPDQARNLPGTFSSTEPSRCFFKLARLSKLVFIFSRAFRHLRFLWIYLKMAQCSTQWGEYHRYHQSPLVSSPYFNTSAPKLTTIVFFRRLWFNCYFECDPQMWSSCLVQTAPGVELRGRPPHLPLWLPHVRLQHRERVPHRRQDEVHLVRAQQGPRGRAFRHHWQQQSAQVSGKTIKFLNLPLPNISWVDRANQRQVPQRLHDPQRDPVLRQEGGVARGLQLLESSSPLHEGQGLLLHHSLCTRFLFLFIPNFFGFLPES